MNQALLDKLVNAAKAEVSSQEEMRGYAFGTLEAQKNAFNTALIELVVKECAELFDKNEIDIRIPEYQIHDSIMVHFGLY